MKSSVIAFILLGSMLAGQSDSLAWIDYFPSEIGNKWWYQEAIISPYDTVQEQYSRYIEVVGDTVMPNGFRYRHFMGYPLMGSGFFRIDTLLKSVFEYIDYGDTSFCPEHEVLRYDLSSVLAFDSLSWCNSYSNCESDEYLAYICRSEGENNIGLGDTTIPFLHYNWWSGLEFDVTLSKGLGMTEYKWLENGGAVGYLTAAEINGIHYEVQLDLADNSDPSPGSYNLSPPYPNPFNPVTTVTYDLPETAPVTLTIYDILGRKVINLVDNRLQTAGHYRVTWDGRDGKGLPLPSGIYITRLVTPTYTSSIKMLLLK